MEPGDVFNLQPAKGVDTGKPWPVLILAVGPTGPHDDKVVVWAFMSSASRLFRDRFEGDIILDDWREYGLREPTVVRCRQIQSGGRHLLTDRRRGRVGPEILHNAQAIARALLD